MSNLIPIDIANALGVAVENLNKENAQLKADMNYLTIENNSNHARWIKALEDLEKYRWQPIETVPLGELVICLWGHRTIGSMIFEDKHDVRYATAKYWTKLPPIPNNGNNS